MERLKKPEELAPYVDHHLMGVGGHQAARMHRNPVDHGRVAEAVPIALLHLARLVGIEEEVAPGRAARERIGTASWMRYQLALLRKEEEPSDA